MAPRGIDETSVSKWFIGHVPSVELPLEFTLIAGGRSNLTYKVEDAAGNRWALRRPPVSHVLPTAHDMSREHRVISAVGPAGVPVATAIGLCTDESVNQAPFYVMEFVDGHILRSAEQVAAAFDEPSRLDIGMNLAETLAALHRIDPDDVGLGDLSRREGYIERQIRRWSEQFRNGIVNDDDYDGLVERVGTELGERIPEQIGLGIVHGDYRLDNTVFSDDGTVRAILDWELCTLGDPMADLGLLTVYWNDRPDDQVGLGVSATTAPGMATRKEILDRYAQASGRDVSALPFYTAFGYWKLACIMQGVYARYLGGAGGGDSGAFDGYPESVRRLATTAAEHLAAW
ncbi:MAG: phosphotransferase family protein [Acidimicrobiales bacterium]